MNDIKLSGRLAKDPIVIYTANQKIVTQFTLAVNRFSNNGKNEADFFPIVFWGKQAELIGNTLKKGSKILVEGRLRVRNYDGKDCKKHWVTEVVGRHFEYMQSKPIDPTSFETFGKEEPIPFSPGTTFEEEIPF